jgi:HAE1 family hydrophobic/amphiphilic exporter-1
MAVAIIGGTLTSTLLTLLIVPSFYDSIEISRDRMFAKFKRRAERWPALLAFGMTLLEALATLTFLRFAWRLLMRGLRFASGGSRRPRPAV